MPRVLLAEDEKKLATFVRKALEAAGFVVEVVHDGDAALETCLSTPFDAVILDIMMPGRDGLCVLKLMRERRIDTPVLILTARGEVTERVAGLDCGADDYLAKPFAMGELLARVQAISRRNASLLPTIIKVADLTMNVLTREVRRAGEKIDLPLREFAVLEHLMRGAGEIHSRTQICERVWGYHFDSGTNLVDVYIKRLRSKIDQVSRVKLIQTVRGVGYTLREPP